MLRAGLLSDRRIALAGTTDEISVGVRGLGADVLELAAGGDEEAAAQWARERAPLHALVFDAGDAFRSGGADRLQSALELAWRAARAVATGAFIESGAGGRLLFVAPRANAGPHAVAVQDGLENLARTLSVEWARFGVTAVAVAPVATTTDSELADLVAFLVSPAGAYFSGCRFDLGLVAQGNSR